MHFSPHPHHLITLMQNVSVALVCEIDEENSIIYKGRDAPSNKTEAKKGDTRLFAWLILAIPYLSLVESIVLFALKS